MKALIYLNESWAARMVNMNYLPAVRGRVARMAKIPT